MTPRRHAIALVLLAALAPFARAGEGEDALALAKRVVDAHRSDEHKERFQVAYPPPRAAPVKGDACVESRSGRYAVCETEQRLFLEESGARLVLVSRKHIPTFAARAAGKRDEGRLLEARVPLARARVALLALELLAGALERPRERSGPGLPPPHEENEGALEATPELPALAVSLDGRQSRRRGPFAELARVLLDEVGKESGLAPPEDLLAARTRLLPCLGETGDRARRAAFVLGDAGFTPALPALAKLDFEEARDARAKIESLAKGEAGLLELSARSPSWDVRAWARERLAGRREKDEDASPPRWIAALLEDGAALEDALVEALRSLAPPYPISLRETVEKLLSDGRGAVRVAAAGLLVRWASLARARELLVKTARDAGASVDLREDAAAQLASSLLPSELQGTLGPLVADEGVPASVRAVCVRSLDAAQALPAAGVLAQALEKELARATRTGREPRVSDEDARDLRGALVSALATTACVGSDSRGEPDETSTGALALAALSEPDDELRAVAIHSTGALPGERAARAVKAALEAEDARKPSSPAALRAAEIETAARTIGQASLLAIADAACTAPTRSTLERLSLAARDGRSRNALIERLRSRGAAGEIALEVLGAR